MGRESQYVDCTFFIITFTRIIWVVLEEEKQGNSPSMVCAFLLFVGNFTAGKTLFLASFSLKKLNSNYFIVRARKLTGELAYLVCRT